MRAIVFLILLFSAVFSYYSSPPIEAVIEHNQDAASDLGEYYDGDIAKHSSTWIFPPNSSLRSSASMAIAGLSLMVENSTSANDDLSVIIVRGYEAGELACNMEEGEPEPPFSCDREYYQDFQAAVAPGWRCDLDDDGCVEYVKDTDVEFGGTVIFKFRNTSVSEEVDGRNEIPIPEEIVVELENASGTDNLTIKLNTTAKFIYEIDDQEMGIGSCASNLFTFNVTFRFSEERNFTVEGNNKLFFLKAPILREQWHLNNRFNVVVFSQSQIYNAEVFLNGYPNCTFITHEFGMDDNEYGIQRVTMEDLEHNASYGLANYQAISLSENNHTYGYFYEFDCPYTGLGENNLTIEVTDLYGRDAAYSEVILSRMLSHGGERTELGGSIEPEVTRQSIEFTVDSMSLLRISAGMLGAFLILAVANRWLLKK